jgi:hypothetical protein
MGVLLMIGGKTCTFQVIYQAQPSDIVHKQQQANSEPFYWLADLVNSVHAMSSNELVGSPSSALSYSNAFGA